MDKLLEAIRKLREIVKELSELAKDLAKLTDVILDVTWRVAGLIAVIVYVRSTIG